MVWRNLGIGVLFLSVVGCGANPNPVPVATNPAAAPAPPKAPTPAPPKTVPPKTVEPDPAELAIPMVGPPGGMPIIAAKPTIPDPDAPEVVVTIKIDPNSSFDDLSARFANARAEKIVQPNGDPELEQLYYTAVRVPYGDKTDPKDRLEFLKAWHEAKPEDPAPLITMAHLHIALGWDARGSGFAGTVSRNGWQVFHDELTTALKFAQQAEKLKADDPEVYRVLVILAKGLAGKREHVDRYVAAGRKIFPAYFPLYASTAEYLLPRWHGEEGDCGKFADEICTAIGGEDGLIAYARVAMITNCYDSDMIYREYDAQKLADGCKAMEKRFPNATYLLNFLAVNSWKAQDHASAQKFYARLRKQKPDMRHWGNQWRYEQFKAFCEAPAATDVADEVHWPYLYGTDDLAYLDGGKVLATSPQAQDELIKIWNRDNMRQPSSSLREFPDKVAEMRGGGKRLLMSAGSSRENTIVAISLDEPEEPVIYKKDNQELGAVLSPDGKTAATISNKMVYLWDPATGQPLHELPNIVEHARMGFSPDGLRLVVSHSKGTQVFDVLEGKLLFELKQATAVGGVHMHRIENFWDADTLFANGNTKTGKFRVVKWLPAEQKVIELLRNEPNRQVTIHAVSQNFIVMSEHGRESNPIVHIHRPSDGKHVRTINGHYDMLSRVLISPDEKEMVVAEFRGPLRFWKLEQPGAQ